MRMRGKKALFNYRDTFSLDSTLASVIKAGLEKFKEVLLERDAKGGCLGIPCGLEDTHSIPFDHDSIEEGFKEWISIIDKMIVGFSEGPSIEDYDFSYDMNDEKVEEGGNVSYTLTCTNEDERDRYWRDCEIHRQQRLEGRELFAKHFEDLWW